MAENHSTVPFRSVSNPTFTDLVSQTAFGSPGLVQPQLSQSSTPSAAATREFCERKSATGDKDTPRACLNNSYI